MSDNAVQVCGVSEMWVVTFVRKDGAPDEEYYYHSKEDAEAHKALFTDDDSDLYERIVVTRWEMT